MKHVSLVSFSSLVLVCTALLLIIARDLPVITINTTWEMIPKSWRDAGRRL